MRENTRGARYGRMHTVESKEMETRMREEILEESAFLRIDILTQN